MAYRMSNPTEEDIRNCSGDYYGCEICRHKHRCMEYMLTDINKIIEEGNKDVGSNKA